MAGAASVMLTKAAPVNDFEPFKAVVLLAEDDPDDQEMTRYALDECDVPTELHVVEDGEQALDFLFRRGAFAQAPRPDLVLLDLNMPRIDGRTVLERMRADPELRGLAVVVLTTSRREEEVARAYELGCNSFMNKPMDIDEFFTAMQGLMEFWFRYALLPPRAG